MGTTARGEAADGWGGGGGGEGECGKVDDVVIQRCSRCSDRSETCLAVRPLIMWRGRLQGPGPALWGAEKPQERNHRHVSLAEAGSSLDHRMRWCFCSSCGWG